MNSVQEGTMLTASQAKQRLVKGNRKYMEAVTGQGDISKLLRKKTAEQGQDPYAIIIACSDSRVIPEHIV